MLRIDRILANRGYVARSSVDVFLKQHDVRVAGTRIGRVDTRVPPDAVVIDGEPIDATTIYLLMHKPVGLVCAHVPEDGNRLIYELLPERWLKRSPPVTSVGRLDKDTSGLLILTDDGDLVHRLTSPKFHVPRTYVATLAKPLRGDEGELFASGTFVLPDDEDADEFKRRAKRGEPPKPLLPAHLESIDATTARLTLREGRYHQVRRMFAAVGNEVVTLHREQFGPLRLDDSLTVGTYRTLTREEVAALVESSRAIRTNA